ncbi:MAG: hypothetical protein ACYCX5_03300 [Coriobacteriia bacterium]
MSSALTGILDRLGRGIGGAGDLFPRLLADPRGYPRETMIVATIAGLLLVFVVLLGFLITDLIKASRRSRRVPVRDRRAAALRWSTLAVGMGVLLAVIALVPATQVASERCVACHEIDASVASWRAGPHALVPCYGCHARPGITGAVERSLERAGSYIGGSDEVTKTGSAVVYRESCLDCHERLLHGVVGTAVRMRHSDVVAAGLVCERCHPQAGHEGGARKDRLVVATMNTCLQCHDDITAPADCDLCHPVGPMDGTDMSKGGDVPTPITCVGCHESETAQRCIDCHGLELPHPVTFLGEHARQSAASPPLCNTCHAAASRETPCACHEDVNVHGTYDRWFPIHGPAALNNGRGGCMCHEASFCQFCHQTSPF